MTTTAEFTQRIYDRFSETLNMERLDMMEASEQYDAIAQAIAPELVNLERRIKKLEAEAEATRDRIIGAALA